MEVLLIFPANMNYTIHHDAYVNSVIESQVKTISTTILKQVKDVVNVSLLGGFARGEGSVKIEKGRVLPLGDYDLLIVTSRPHFNLRINGLDELAEKFGMGHIDIAYVWKPRLSIAGKSLFWYEVKFGSQVLYGDHDLLEKIPMYNVMDIDLKEGIKLLVNRLAGMFQCYKPEFIHDKLSQGEREYMIYQTVKASLACGESLLLLIRRYHPKQLVKLDRLSKSFHSELSGYSSVNPQLLSNYEKALKFKMTPSFEMYPDELDFWFSTKRDVLLTTRFFLERYKNLKINRQEEIPEYLLTKSSLDLIEYLKFESNIFKRKRRFTNLFQRRSIYDIFGAALIYLALSTRKDGIDDHFIEKAVSIIDVLIPYKKMVRGSPLQKWRKTKEILLEIWGCLH